MFPNFEHLTLTGGEPQDWPWLEQFILDFDRCPGGPPFALQVSTALCRSVLNPVVWRRAVRDVRVSLDAVDSMIYEQIRGVRVDPEEILANMVALNHPRIAIIVTLYPENIRHFSAIYCRLYNLVKDGHCSIRRIMVLPGMGLAKANENMEFREKWRELAVSYRAFMNTPDAGAIPTSFAEDPFLVRTALTEDTLSKVPCYVGASTFHTKANGDVYPCCLVGGEAVGTHENYRFGNVWQDPAEVIWRVNKVPLLRYADPESYCAAHCFWKQATLNVEAHKASRYCLSMP